MMKLVKNLMLVSVLGAFYSAQAEMSSLAKAFYAEASEAGKRGAAFDQAALDRILSPEFVLDCNNGQLVRSQSELKIHFTELKKRAGGWAISHLVTLPCIQEGVCDRILFLWSVPGGKDVVVDAHLYSSTGKQLDKMVATVVFKDEGFKLLADGFLQGLNKEFSKWNVISRDAAVTFDSATKALVFTCIVADDLGKKFYLAVALADALEKSDKKSA